MHKLLLVVIPFVMQFYSTAMEKPPQPNKIRSALTIIIDFFVRAQSF
jgi:hypothetical protein